MVKQWINIQTENKNQAFLQRLRYVLNYLQQHPYCPEGVRFRLNDPKGASLLIDYGQHPAAAPNRYRMFAQEVFFAKDQDQVSDLFPNAYTHDTQQLFSVELHSRTPHPFLQDRQFGFDIFETLFFHISRWEEHHCTPEQLDEWDAMCIDQQLLPRHGLHQQPVVDQLVRAFYTALGFTPPRPKPQIILTHDIDRVQKFDQPLRVLRHLAVLLLYQQLPAVFNRTLQDWWAYLTHRTSDPYDNFEDLLLAGDHFERKVIYFMAGGHSRYDHPYDLFTPRLQTIFKLAKDRGYQLGLHPSYHTWKNKELFQQEWERLCEVTGEEIQYTRQHYLHFSWSHTPQIIERLGLKDDSTLGYNHCTGYRCGTGYSYQLYNFTEERAYRFTETPLVVMDSSVAKEGTWEQEKVEQIWEKWLWKEDGKGQLCFNFHNMFMDSYQVRDLDLEGKLNRLRDVRKILP